MNSTFFSNHPGAIHAIIQNRPRQNSSAQTEATTFTFSSVFILIQWVGPSVQVYSKDVPEGKAKCRLYCLVLFMSSTWHAFSFALLLLLL